MQLSIRSGGSVAGAGNTFGASAVIALIALAVLPFPLADNPLHAADQSDAPTSNAESSAESATQTPSVLGAELFRREWLPNDPRSHGGDGLGPVFNDSSCIACHNQGGAGGGGPADKNVDIASAFLNDERVLRQPKQSALGSLVRLTFGIEPAPTHRPSPQQLEQHRQSLIREVALLHPGFVTARSVVVHLHGTTNDYSQWRSNLIGFGSRNFAVHSMPAPMTPVAHVHEVPTESVEVVLEDHAVAEAHAGEHADHGAHEGAAGGHQHVVVHAPSPAAMTVIGTLRTEGMQGHAAGLTTLRGNFTLVTTQRNPSALFGVGLIDSIPDDVLLAVAAKSTQFPGISGRVARLADQRIGRFGWKAQKSSLREFAMTACAVELGLHVPEHVQSGLPTDPDYKPAGYDMNKAECDALVDYLERLPAPLTIAPSSPEHAEYLEDGRTLFNKVGCTGCHTERLGEVAGIYSDLLLHDMGEDLGDTGDYGVFVPETPGGDAEGVVPPLAAAAGQSSTEDQVLGATRLEWRTPPLWGVRDSAPYMHDGRAKNLEQAVAFHGGEGLRSAQLYFSLSAADRQKVQAFLKSLVAPTTVAAR